MAGGKGIVIQIEGEGLEAVKAHLHVVARAAAAQHQLDHMQDGAANGQAGDEGQAVTNKQRQVAAMRSEMPSQCGARQGDNGGGQPMARLGVMGDAIQEAVGTRINMIIDEMGRAPINRDRRRAQHDQQRACPE